MSTKIYTNIYFYIQISFANIIICTKIQISHAMFMNAYDELIKCKNNDLTPAYGATLILATLFEKDLKEHTKRIYAKQYLNLLKTEISISLIILSVSKCPIFVLRIKMETNLTK